VIINFELPYKP